MNIPPVNTPPPPGPYVIYKITFYFDSVSISRSDNTIRRPSFDSVSVDRSDDTDILTDWRSILTLMTSYLTNWYFAVPADVMVSNGREAVNGWIVI